MKRPLSLFLTSLLILLTFNQNSYGQNTGKNITNPEANLSNDPLIKVGYFEFPGLTYTDESGKPAGFVNEITIKALERAGIKYTMTSYPAARFFDYLTQGKIDLFNGLSLIESVRASMLSSNLKLFPLNMRVYWIGDKKKIEKKEDLKGQSVIMVRGFSYKDWGKWIRNKANGVLFYEADTHEAAFEMLKKGRATYLLNYKYIDDECLKAVKIHNLVINTPPAENVWYCSFNINKKTPNARRILKKLEDSYLELIAEGKLKDFN